MTDQTGAAPAQTNQGQSYTVAAGDTLSGIGAKLGTNSQDIYNANKATIGANPNIIRPGMVLTIPGQGGSPQGGSPQGGSPQGGSSPTGTSGNTSDFKLDIPSTVDSTTLNSALNNPITQKDLEDAVAKTQTLNTNITNESGPSQNETDLTNQIQQIKNQVNTEKNQLSQYEGNLGQEGISEGAIKGRSASMAFSVNQDLQTLALRETNLMTELGMDTTTRKTQLAEDQNSLKAAQDTINNFKAIQTVIDTEKSQASAQAARLDTQSRQYLQTILTQFKGVAWKDMTLEQQNALSDVASKYGIDQTTLQLQLDANAHQTELNTQAKTYANVKSQQTIATNNQNLSSLNLSGLNKTQQTAVQSLMDKINADKQTVNFQTLASAKSILAGLGSANSASDQAAVLAQFASTLSGGSSTSISRILPQLKIMFGDKIASGLLKAEQTVANNGTLSSNVITGITNTVNTMYNSKQSAYKDYINNNYITPSSKNLGISDLSSRFDTILNPGSSSSSNTSGTVTMVGPKGTYTVSSDKVSIMQKNGYSIKK